MLRRVPIRTARVAVSPSRNAAGAALVVDDLRIAFEIRSSNDKDPDPSSVAIYNLSDEKAGGLFKDQLMTLEAGYNAPAHLLFSGYVRSVNHDRDGVDRITELFTGPASEIDRSVWVVPQPGVGSSEDELAPTYRNRVLALTRAMQIGINGPSLDLVPTTYMTHAGMHHTRLRDELTTVLGRVGLTWYIESDVLYVRPKGESARYVTPGQAPMVISEGTNMIDSPSRVESNETGVRVRVVLTSAVRIDTPLWITSRIISGKFKAKTIAHKGDTWTGDWYTEIEGDVDRDQSFIGRAVDYIKDFFV